MRRYPSVYLAPDSHLALSLLWELSYTPDHQPSGDVFPTDAHSPMLLLDRHRLPPSHNAMRRSIPRLRYVVIICLKPLIQANIKSRDAGNRRTRRQIPLPQICPIANATASAGSPFRTCTFISVVEPFLLSIECYDHEDCPLSSLPNSIVPVLVSQTAGSSSVQGPSYFPM